MSELIVEILEGILGEPKNHYENKGQISFDCPVCSHEIKGLDKGDGKGNLEINYNKNQNPNKYYQPERNLFGYFTVSWAIILIFSNFTNKIIITNLFG